MQKLKSKQLSFQQKNPIGHLKSGLPPFNSSCPLRMLHKILILFKISIKHSTNYQQLLFCTCNMSESIIQQEERVYMAMMDLKMDIEKIKSTLKRYDEKMNQCYRLSNKTYRQMNDKFNEVVQVISSSHDEITNQNALMVKQNQIHNNLTKSNEDLVMGIKQQNNRVNEILTKQKIQIERVLQANQKVVNEELTGICRGQQRKINEQMELYNKQNQFIEEQKTKIQLALEAVANFQHRNRQLEDRLTAQNRQIEQYIESATKNNHQVVIKEIYNKAEEADRNYQAKVQNIQSKRRQFEACKNQAEKQLNEMSKRIENNIQSQINIFERLKNEMQHLRNQSERFSNEQNSTLKDTKRELENMRGIGNDVRNQMKNIHDKERKIQHRVAQAQNTVKNYGNDQGRMQKNVKDIQMRIDDESRKNKGMIDQIKKDLSAIDDTKKALSSLQNRVKELQNKSKHDQHHPHPHPHYK